MAKKYLTAERDQLRLVEGRDNLPAQHRPEPLDPVEVSMFDRHDACSVGQSTRPGQSPAAARCTGRAQTRPRTTLSRPNPRRAWPNRKFLSSKIGVRVSSVVGMCGEDGGGGRPHQQL